MCDVRCANIVFCFCNITKSLPTVGQTVVVGPTATVGRYTPVYESLMPVDALNFVCFFGAVSQIQFGYISSYELITISLLLLYIS